MCTNERSYQHRNRLQPARHPALTFYSVRLLRHASIPVPAPPPTHALTAPLVVLGARHADARRRVRARECGHAMPRVERGVRGTCECERHLGREDRAEGRLQTVGEAGERCGLAGEEDVLRESQTVSVRSVSAVGWASGEERGEGGYLHESPAFGEREGAEDVLEDFAKPGRVDTCHIRGEPGLGDAPPLGGEVDPSITCMQVSQ